MQIKYRRAWQQEEDRMCRYYAGLLTKYGVSAYSLDWGSKRSQELRFKVLSDIGDLNGAKILDIGCGLADFYNWLNLNKISVEYSGIDITAEMIEKAAKRFPDASLSVGNLLKDFENTKNEYEYVFASGIFTFREIEPYDFFECMLLKMFEVCSKGLGLNLLSSWSSKKSVNEFCADPIKIITMCKKISNKIVFRHDYLPNDFSIFLYK